MPNVRELILERIDAEYARTMDKLARLTKLRNEIANQESQHIERFLIEQRAAKIARKDSPPNS